MFIDNEPKKRNTAKGRWIRPSLADGQPWIDCVSRAIFSETHLRENVKKTFVPFVLSAACSIRSFHTNLSAVFLLIEAVSFQPWLLFFYPVRAFLAFTRIQRCNEISPNYRIVIKKYENREKLAREPETVASNIFQMYFLLWICRKGQFC